MDKTIYYVQTTGHRWATQAADHATLEGAERDAAHTSLDCMEVKIWRVNLKRPGVSVLESTWHRGVKTAA